jgi:hypothetical protein
MEPTPNALANTAIAVILNEGRWFTMSMTLALSGGMCLLYRTRGAEVHPRGRAMATMSLGAGLTVGTMALGHLLAVTVKALIGTLEGSWARFYAIGLVLAVPSWSLIVHTPSILASDGTNRRTVMLHAWLAATLLALGPHNLPLAAPALLNVGYGLHARQAVGWLLISASAVVNAGLFVGSLVFWMSGQSFEQFRGIR